MVFKATHHLCVLKLVSVLACRAVQCQQFEMALLLLEAGADPMYTCTTADGNKSLPPLTAVMHAIPTGEHTLFLQLLLPSPTFRRILAKGLLHIGMGVVSKGCADTRLKA